MSSIASNLSYQTTVSTASTTPTSFPPSPVKPAAGNRDVARDRFNSATGARLVAGVVVLSNRTSHPEEPERKYVLCISSSRHRNKIVLPKGGWEFHETIEQAALRECWEEAGVQGTVDRLLHAQPDSRPPKNYSLSPKELVTYADGSQEEVTKYKGLEFSNGKVPPRAEYQYFQVTPTQVCADWPESDKRLRKWLTYAEARVALEGREEMVRSLESSDILRE